MHWFISAPKFSQKKIVGKMSVKKVGAGAGMGLKESLRMVGR
jgi:hypothetical protein